MGVLALAPGLWWLLGLYVLLQVAGNVAQSASQALIPDLVPSADIDRASGIKNGLDLAGTLLGLSVAGGLVAIGVADRAVLPFLAGLVAFGGVAVWKIVPSSPVSARQSQDSAPRTIGRAFAPLRDGSTQFKAALATRFLFLLGFYPIQRFLVFLLEDRFEVEDPVTQASAAIFAAVALGAVAAAVAGPVSDAIGRRAVLAGSILVTGAGVLGVAVVPTLVGSQSQVARLRSAPVLSRRRTGPHSPAPYPKARVPVTSGSRTWRRRAPRRRSDFLGPSSMG
ncbi:MAG: MFS transporter [Tepidiformaceae bacterium]